MKSKLLWIFLLLCPLFSFGQTCSGSASTPVYNGTGVLPVQYCLGESTTPLSANSSTPGILVWFTEDGTPTNTPFGNGGAPTPTTTTADIGTTNYKVVLVPTNPTLCISDTLIIPVLVHDNPIITTSGITTICQGDGTVLSASGAGSGGSYFWNGGLVDNATVTFTPSTNTTYTVRGTDQFGCQGFANAVITVNPLPSPPTTDPSNVTEYCLNDASPSELLATPLSGHTLIWYDASNTVLSTTSSRTPSTGTVGPTLYKVTQTDANGCESSTLNITVTVSADPSAPSVSDIAYCKDAVASALSATASTVGTLVWYDTDGTTVLSGAPTPSTGTVGTTTYYVAQQTAGGCEGPKSSITVTIDPLPSAPTATSSVSYCKNEVATALSATASSGHTLVWYDTDGTTVLSGAPTPLTSNVGTTTYYVAQENTTTDCEGPKATITVTVLTLPAAPSVSSTTIDYCQGAVASALSATVTSGSGNTLVWYDSDASTVLSGAPTPQTTTAGTKKYYVSQKNASDCVSPQVEITVTVNALPSISVVGGSSQTVCDGSPVILSGSGAGSGGSYSWSGGISNGVSFTPSSSSSYTVTGTDGNGCSSPATASVTVNALPSISVLGGASQTVCDGSSITLNGDGGVSYSWSGVDASGNAISNGVSFVPPGSTTTTYVVTGTDGNGCNNTSSIDVISTALPTINATIANIYNGYGVSCEGNNDGAIQTNVQGGKAPYTYNWNNGSNSATLSNLSEGTYIVIVEDSNGCLSTDSITIDEPSALSYLYVVEDVTCYDEQDGKIELYPTGGVAPYTISWFDGSSLNYLNNLSNAYYSFTIRDANNCSTIDSIQVYEPTDLLITVDTIQPTCERINDGEIDAFIYGGTYPYSYTLNGSPVDLPLDSVAVGNYVLTVEDSNSCTQTIAFNLTPLQPSCFMIPNMYSPNYDGYNDVFTISHSSWSSYTMNIYNSIGQLVYSGSSSTPYWDGITNGNPMPTGDYYYQLITNEGEVIYGYVTLIR